MRFTAVALALTVVLAEPLSPAAVTQVEVVRVPAGGLQPEVVVGADGTIHMVYLAGEPGGADVFYARSTDGGQTFSRAMRVNSEPASAIPAGTVRGAQIALGRGGRAHVAWNGSSSATPKPPADPRTKQTGMPMLYARSDASGVAFEPQRNLITRTSYLDGGGSIAADASGRVWVVWHGHAAGDEADEGTRRIWIARSEDDGATFAAESPIEAGAAGVCGCCALRAAHGPGRGELHVLYRSATDRVHRDMFSIRSRDGGVTFSGGRLQAWEIGACPMTSMSIVPAGQGSSSGTTYRAWETDGQVYFDAVDSAGTALFAPVGPAGEAPRRKHPRLAVADDGTVLLAWTEGTAWARGGSIAWAAFDARGRPIGATGTRAGLPAWSFAASAPRRDGGFIVFY